MSLGSSLSAVPLLLLAALIAEPVFMVLPARADTIVLKNGSRIVAESIVEQGDKITYEGTYGSVTIPRTQVERIERGGSLPPRPSATSSSPRSFAAFGNAQSPRITNQLPMTLWLPTGNDNTILLNGAINERLLSDLAREAWSGDVQRQSALNAHLLAAAYEVRQRRTAVANKLAEQALVFSSQDRTALLLAAQIDLLGRNYSEAREHLLVAQANHPESWEILAYLGYAAYYSESAEKANYYWKQAYALRPDAQLRALMDQVEKEAAVEGGQRDAESYHFMLKWEGTGESERFGKQVLETLEQHYTALEISLNFTPREPVSVILYSAQQFQDITQAPSWAGALNDGKIRVPVQGLTSMTAELSRVLKHELVHSFVHLFVQGNCPVWLNEGIAEAESGRGSSEYARSLSRIFAASRQLPMQALEGGFTRFNSATAIVAYGQSVATVEMIREKYGEHQIPELLKALRDGQTLEAALRTVLRLSYADLNAEVAEYVKKLYVR